MQGSRAEVREDCLTMTARLDRVYHCSRPLAHYTPGGYNGSMTTTSPTHNHHHHTTTDADMLTVDESTRHSTSYSDDKAKILARLRRVEGQLRGVQKMVENDQYCLDILTQLSAI